MPIFPPRNEAIRKKEIFDYKLFELLRGVEKNYPVEKLEKLAEKVRVSKLNLIKAELHLIKSYSEEGYKLTDIEKIENLDYQIMRWQSLDYYEMIQEAEDMYLK